MRKECDCMTQTSHDFSSAFQVWWMHVSAWLQVMGRDDTIVPGKVKRDCRIIFGQTPGASQPHQDSAPPSPEAIEVSRARCAQTTA